MINHEYSDIGEYDGATALPVMPLPGEYDAVDARRTNIGAFKRATKSAFASGRL